MKDLLNTLVQNARSVYVIDVCGLSAAALMTLAVFVTGIQPILAHRQELRDQREMLATERSRADSLSRTAQQLRSHLRATQRAVDRNPMRLASRSALNERLSEMTTLATDSGLRIEGIQPGRGIPGDHYHTVPIKLTGAGEFGASTRFLHRLHESFPDVAIASLTLDGQPQRAGARGDSPPTFELTLLWYAAPPSETQAQARAEPE